MHFVEIMHACVDVTSRVSFSLWEIIRANSIVSPGLVRAHEAGRDALAAEVEDEAEVDGKVDVDA